MKRIMGVLVAAVALTAAEKKVQMADLPAAVRKTVQEQIKNSSLVGITKESENHKTIYEVETTANGRTRDLLVDSAGLVVEVEQETEMAAVPAPARDAIQKKVGKGSVTKVEALSKNGNIVAYEAAVRNGKKTSEVAFTPAGLPYKD